MKFVADLHIHSHYSRATSKQLNFEHLYKWAQLKGIHVVGTGDISHPGWLQEMKEKLEPAEEGLFKLKDEFARQVQQEIPAACQTTVRFLPAGEISSIYKKNERVRKIHNVIFAPTLESVEKIQAALEKIGNIRSDGRPILGLDSRDLLEIILDIDEQNYLIPAHIWTPWFSLLGSKSGFDSVEECFEDLTPHIFALETGLSSDPPMNWRVSALDKYTLVSNSDAHSPQKLAREANLFNTQLSYPAIFKALKTGNPQTFPGTMEFFPEEGKYHYDGHRKCGISWNPKTTLAHNGICSKCGKPVTVGVMHRVEMLADRAEGTKPARHHPFQSLVPLPEILSEVYGVGPTSKRVKRAFEALLSKLGSELSILQDLPPAEISQVGGPLLAEGIKRMRCGKISTVAGYDGEYGIVKLFDKHERDLHSPQSNFFPAAKKKAQPTPKSSPVETAPAHSTKTSTEETRKWAQSGLFNQHPPETTKKTAPGNRQSIEETLLAALNIQQKEAVLCLDAPLIITAGPGTGKTRTLTHRIAYLIAENGVPPGNILAITFTNKAAEEMTRRLTALLGANVAQQIIIKTFHAFGAMILRREAAQIGLDPRFAICSEPDRLALLKRCAPDLSNKEIQQQLEQISAAKNQLLPPTPPLPGKQPQQSPQFISLYENYQLALQKNRMLDFDDLIFSVVTLFETHPQTVAAYQERFQWISVDEYQDINHAQYRLLQLLTASGNNLCAIGDPDQAIYGFRGADREYFLKFGQDFPTAQIKRLSQNYRSTQLILDASAQVIAGNPEQDRVKIWSQFLDQTRLNVYQAATHKAEAEYVVHEIEKLVGGTSYFSIDSGRVDDEGPSARTFSDFAVLYRLRAQSQALIEAFDRSGIPYQTVGQTPLYEYREIKVVLAYLWFINNPNAIYHLEIILNAQRALFNRETIENLLAYAVAHKITVWNIVLNYKIHNLFTPTQQKQLSHIVPFLVELKTGQAPPVSQLIERVGKSILNLLGDRQAERIQRLILQAAPFDNRLSDFLESTLLQKETDIYDPRADRVTLMTLHASKGLEFPVVFVAGCEETLLPCQMKGKIFNVDEERRLFYVGMTRAQQKLVLTHAKSRFLFGQTQKNEPSRFLTDIEDTLKEIKKMARRKKSTKKEEDTTQLKLF